VSVAASRKDFAPAVLPAVLHVNRELGIEAKPEATVALLLRLGFHEDKVKKVLEAVDKLLRRVGPPRAGHFGLRAESMKPKHAARRCGRANSWVRRLPSTDSLSRRPLLDIDRNQSPRGRGGGRHRPQPSPVARHRAAACSGTCGPCSAGPNSW